VAQITATVQACASTAQQIVSVQVIAQVAHVLPAHRIHSVVPTSSASYKTARSAHLIPSVPLASTAMA
jgi:hypothetical protein